MCSPLIALDIQIRVDKGNSPVVIDVVEEVDPGHGWTHSSSGGWHVCPTIVTYVGSSK